jgi:hypothetical protein
VSQLFYNGFGGFHGGKSADLKITSVAGGTVKVSGSPTLKCSGSKPIMEMRRYASGIQECIGQARCSGNSCSINRSICGRCSSCAPKVGERVYLYCVANGGGSSSSLIKSITGEGGGGEEGASSMLPALLLIGGAVVVAMMINR